jgi:hypothetical protein
LKYESFEQSEWMSGNRLLIMPLDSLIVSAIWRNLSFGRRVWFQININRRQFPVENPNIQTIQDPKGLTQWKSTPSKPTEIKFTKLDEAEKNRRALKGLCAYCGENQKL